MKKKESSISKGFKLPSIVNDYLVLAIGKHPSALLKAQIIIDNLKAYSTASVGLNNVEYRLESDNDYYRIYADNVQDNQEDFLTGFANGVFITLR